MFDATVCGLLGAYRSAQTRPYPSDRGHARIPGVMSNHRAPQLSDEGSTLTLPPTHDG